MYNIARGVGQDRHWPVFDNMADLLLFFIFPKFFAGIYAGTMLAIYYRMRQRNLADPWIYIASSWSWGWFASVQFFMFILCTIGMLIAQRISLRTMHKQHNQWDNTVAMFQRIDEVYTQWDRGELSDDEFDVLLQTMRQEREKQRAQEMAMVQ